MNPINWKNTLVLGPVLCGLAMKLVKKKFLKQCNAPINEVLLYGERDHRAGVEVGLENLFCIYYVVAHAARTVDVCVPSLASETMAKCLISVQKKRRARVRIAIHGGDDLTGNPLSNLSAFARAGIEVKVIRSAQRLEHEFMLLDAALGAHALALLGALDYGTARVNCHRDMTLLTSEPRVLADLQREFDRVWSSTPDLVRLGDDQNSLQ